MKVAAILDSVAVGLDAADAAIEDPAISAATKGAALVVRTVAALLKDRTPEEAVAILEHIRDNGTAPITAGELASQVDKAVRGG